MLEITTLAIGGMALAIPERPYSVARPFRSHGTPIDGKSVGITPRARCASALMAPAASRIARRRFTGLAICVFRLTSVSVACVVYSVSPAVRSEIGIAAINGFFG